MNTLRNIARLLAALFGIAEEEHNEWDGYDREQNMED